jgi:hypothetical protein
MLKASRTRYCSDCTDDQTRRQTFSCGTGGADCSVSHRMIVSLLKTHHTRVTSGLWTVTVLVETPEPADETDADALEGREDWRLVVQSSPR